jgi:hypothetical protein
MKTKQRLFGAATLALFQTLFYMYVDKDYWRSICFEDQPIPFRWWFFAILSVVLYTAGLKRKPTNKLDE